jgi:hypothetical protein
LAITEVVGHENFCFWIDQYTLNGAYLFVYLRTLTNREVKQLALTHDSFHETLPQLANVCDLWVEGLPSFLLGQKLLWFGAVTVEKDVILSEMPNVNK